MKYYKVVLRKNKKLYSGNPDFAKSVRYINNKWTVPPKKGNQFLFVFNDLHTANHWRWSCANITSIYECEIGNIIPIFRKNIYGIKSYVGSIQIDGCVPAATVLTNKVKLIKRIK